MTPVQLFLFAGLPLIVGIVGVVAGETFRARHIRRDDETGTPDLEMNDIWAQIETLIKFWTDDPERRKELALKFYPRHTNQASGLSERRGSVLVGTLRKTYGDTFAEGFKPDALLRDVLIKLDTKSLTQLIYDYEAGTLEKVLTFSRALSNKRQYG